METKPEADHSWLKKGVTAWYGRSKILVYCEPYLFNGKLIVDGRYDMPRNKNGGMFDVDALHSIPWNH